MDLSGIPYIGSLFDSPTADNVVNTYNTQADQAGKNLQTNNADFNSALAQALGNYSGTQNVVNQQSGPGGALSGPGAGENLFSQLGGQYSQPTQSGQQFGASKSGFGAPGAGEQYWNGISGKAGDVPFTAQNAQGAYDQFQASTPANMDPYYNRAQQLQEGAINSAAAARGMGGASSTTNQLAASDTNLRAQQAKDEAQYGLNRAQLGGQLASGADQSSSQNIQNRLGWMTGLGSLANQTQSGELSRLLGGMQGAGQADTANLNLLTGGMNAADQAQAAELAREQALFGNNFQLGGAQATMTEQAKQQQMAAQIQQQQLQQQLAIAAATQQFNQHQQNTQALTSGLTSLGSMALGGLGAGALGGNTGASSLLFGKGG